MKYEDLHAAVMEEKGEATGCVAWQEALLKVIAPLLPYPEPKSVKRPRESGEGE